VVAAREQNRQGVRGENLPGRCLGPETEATLRQALLAQPEALAIIDQEFDSGTPAVAEDEQGAAERVIALGCNEAQGYHYASPMLEEEFVAWLATQRRIHS